MTQATDPQSPNAPDSDELPYIFDLLYDIKTLSSLHGHLTGRERLATSATDQELVALMLEHGLALPADYSAPLQELAVRYEQAIALLRQLREHLTPSPEHGTSSGPDTAWMKTSIEELLAQHAKPLRTPD